MWDGPFDKTTIFRWTAAISLGGFGVVALAVYHQQRKGGYLNKK